MNLNVWTLIVGDWEYGINLRAMKVWKEFLSDHTAGGQLHEASMKLEVYKAYSWSWRIVTETRYTHSEICGDVEFSTDVDDEVCQCGEGGEYSHTRWLFSISRDIDAFGLRRRLEKAKEAWGEFHSIYLDRDPNICKPCQSKASLTDGLAWRGLGDQTSLDSRGYHRVKHVGESKAAYNCTHYWHVEALCGLKTSIFIDSGD